jgi:Uncharacterized protein conserved in bacteria (DUF2066)
LKGLPVPGETEPLGLLATGLDMTVLRGRRVTARRSGQARAAKPYWSIGLFGLAISAFVAEGVAAEDRPYAVAKLSVDATAKDAVAAKEMAMAEAEQRGIRVVLKRLVPFSAYAQLPDLQQQDVEEMVEGVAVRSEQNSTTRYLATLDVSFNEQAVKQLLQSYGIALSEARAPSISILPLVIEGDAVKSEGAEGWRQAWTEVDLAHSMTPANILQPRPGLDVQTIKAILAGDARAYASMRSAYGDAPLVIAVGQPVDGGKFATRLVGADSVGPINFGRSDRIYGGDVKSAARNASAIAFGILENRWKEEQSGAPQVTAVRHEDGTEVRPGAEAGTARNVVADVEFAGLKDWQDIRARLMNVPGIQALEVNSLSARTASITFDYAGSLGHLQNELGQNGFSFDDRNGTFVLRAR